MRGARQATSEADTLVHTSTIIPYVYRHLRCMLTLSLLLPPCSIFTTYRVHTHNVSSILPSATTPNKFAKIGVSLESLTNTSSSV